MLLFWLHTLVAIKSEIQNHAIESLEASDHSYLLLSQPKIYKAYKPLTHKLRQNIFLERAGCCQQQMLQTMKHLVLVLTCACLTRRTGKHKHIAFPILPLQCSSLCSMQLACYRKKWKSCHSCNTALVGEFFGVKNSNAFKILASDNVFFVFMANEILVDSWLRENMIQIKAALIA